MTLKKSSVNPFRFTFINTCKKNVVFPIALFLFGIYAFPSGTLSWIYHIKELLSGVGSNADGYRLLENTVFVLGKEDVKYTAFLIDVLCCVAACLLAVSVFRYAMNKKSVNVYFSLGITSREMFWSKYLSGAFLLFISTLVPVIISVILNVVYFGVSSLMLKTALYLYLTYFGYMLYCYTATVLVCCNVGTVFEAIVFGLTLAALPVVTELMCGSFFGDLVYGSTATRDYFYDIAAIDGSYKLTSYDKLMEDILCFSTSDYINNVEYINADIYHESTYEAPHVLPLIIKYVFIAVYLFASARSYKSRKAEIAGFLGTNAVITSIGTFTIAAAVIFLAGESVVSFSRSVWGTILVCLLIVTLVYIIVETVSHRSVKLIFKKIWKLPVQIFVMCLIITVFATGFFGYSTKVPDANEVVSVDVTTCTDDSFIASVSENRVYTTANDSAFLSNHIVEKTYTIDYAMTMDEGSAGIIEGFDKPEEINTVIDVHKKLIELKNAEAGDGYGNRITNNVIVISYKLKNGKRLERMYLISNDEIRRQLAGLTRTENYTVKAADSLVNHFSGAGHLDATLLTHDYSKAAIPPEFDEKNEALRLIEAVSKDILEGNLPLDFNSDSKVIGYIGIGDGETGIINREEFVVSFTAKDFAVTIPVYENMVHTLAILEESDCLTYFNESDKPVKVEKWKLDSSAFDFSYVEFKSSMLYGLHYSGFNYADRVESIQQANNFIGSETVAVEYYDPGTKENLVLVEAPSMAKTSVDVTHTDEAMLLYENIRMISLDCFEGYYVKLTYADGSATYGYVPLSLIK